MLAVDKKNLEEILEHFHALTGFRIAVLDDRFTELASCPDSISDFCRCLRESPEADLLCRDCDRNAFRIASETGRLHVYQCAFGLYEAVMPIAENGEIIGCLMIGQMVSAKNGTSRTVPERSRRYWVSEENRERLFDRLPLLDYRKIQAAAAIMEICASWLVMTQRVQKQKPRLTVLLEEYLDRNYKKNLTVEELCARFAIGRTTFFNLMKTHFGKSLKDYCGDLRQEEAASLLASTDLSIKEIAYIVGYADQNYFSRAFGKKHGTTPKEYREQKRRINEPRTD